MTLKINIARYFTQKPILYLGTGQGYDDLAPFRSELVVEGLGLAGS